MPTYDFSQYNGVVAWNHVTAECVLIRCSSGRAVDTQYHANWVGTVHIPRRGAYHYVVTGDSAAEQVKTILFAIGGDWGTEPFTVDVERTKAEREAMDNGWVFPVEAYTAMLKELVTLLLQYTPVRLYTSKVEWEVMTTRPNWAVALPHWIAHYNTHISEPDRPAGWDWQLWQYGQELIPGVGAVDVSRENKMMPVPEITKGPKIGLHSITNANVLRLVQKWASLGYVWPLVKKVNDASPLIRVKEMSPKTLTIGRYINTSEYESLQSVGSWSLSKMQQFAKDSIQLILGRTSDAQLRATDRWTVINESNPRDEPNGYTGLGHALIELVLEADRHNLKLSLPSSPQGCPEWNQGVGAIGGGDQELAATGLFGLLKSGGHWLDMHEGVFDNQPVEMGYGGSIPRAPTVFGAGVYNFRHNYLYHVLQERDEVVPLVISEFYAGGGYTDFGEVMRRFAWYDHLARVEPYLLAFLGFTIDPDATWIKQNYSPFHDSNELQAYWDVEKDIPNVEVPMDIAKILADATTARNASQAIMDEINGAPLFMATVLQGVKVRDSAGHDLNQVLTVGTQIAVYKENVTAGTFQQRAVVNVNGNNIVMVNNGTPTYQKV